MSRRVRSRITTTLDYSNDDQACDAAFVGGPVALAWSRLDNDARSRASARYLDAIGTWRNLDRSYRIPGEFVIVGGDGEAHAQPIS